MVGATQLTWLSFHTILAVVFVGDGTLHRAPMASSTPFSHFLVRKAASNSFTYLINLMLRVSSQPYSREEFLYSVFVF